MPACHAACIKNYDKNGGKKSEKFIEEPYCDWTDLYHPFADYLLRSYPDVQQCTEIEGISGPCEYGYNLPGNVVYKAEDVVGKYANTDMCKGDYILESKLSDTPMLKNAYLGKLNGENRAISVSIKSFAAGLSGKLEAGDIVTLIASDVGEKRETLVLPELQYVEIIATTASSGTDNDVQADVEDGEEQELASTITVLATPEQARLLAELEQTGKLHAALVFRGDSTQAEKFLDEQQKVLEELYTEEVEEEAETAEADAEEEKEEPIVDDVEVNAGGQ